MGPSDLSRLLRSYICSEGNTSRMRSNLVLYRLRRSRFRAYILVIFPLCAGIGVGVMMGWFEGFKDAERLSGTYGRGSVYKGTFATFSHIQCVCVCVCVSMRICACAHMSAYVCDHASVHAYSQRSCVNTSRARSLQVVLEATWSTRTKRCCKRCCFCRA